MEPAHSGVGLPPPPLVIIGGGLLSLVLAEQLASRGHRVDVLVSERSDPRTDSQRNHSWLQSGLLYEGNPHARSMYYDGLGLLDSYGYPPPTERGIFRFTSEAEVVAFTAHAKRLRLWNKVRLLGDREAKKRLGAFYQPNRFQFEVPDAPFPEAEIMELARARAVRSGARFYQCRVALERDESASNHYVIRAAGKRLAPATTIVCAGAGTPKLLRDLGLPHPLCVSHSTLLVIDDASALPAALLADRASGLTVVSWSAAASPPCGRLVIGSRDRRRMPPEGEDLVREVRREEAEELLAQLPDCLRGDAVNRRFTAGHKTDVLVQDKPTVAPWTYAPEEYPGLIFATPGKATLAFAIAERVRVLAQKSRGQTAILADDLSARPPGSEWTAPIQPHFGPAYDKLDERASDENDQVDEKETNQCIKLKP